MDRILRHFSFVLGPQWGFLRRAGEGLSHILRSLLELLGLGIVSVS